MTSRHFHQSWHTDGSGFPHQPAVCHPHPTGKGSTHGVHRLRSVVSPPRRQHPVPLRHQLGHHGRRPPGIGQGLGRSCLRALPAAEHISMCPYTAIGTRQIRRGWRQMSPTSYFIYIYYSYSVTFIARASSSNCFWSITPGASSMTSRPLLFLGKAMTSRMLSNSAKRLTKRSRP